MNKKLMILTGLVEGTFYPGLQYIIGSWYRKDELAKRTCIFHISSVLGAMFSGYLMAGVYHLGDNSKYAGWQWYVSDAQGLQCIEADHPISGSSSSTVSSRFLSLWVDSSSTLTFLKLKSLGTYQNR